MSFNQMLNKTLTIERQKDDPDLMGGSIKNWVAIGATKAMVSPAALSSIVKYQAMNVKITHTLYLPPTADIKDGDRLTLGARHFIVKGGPKNPAEAGHHYEVACEEEVAE